MNASNNVNLGQRFCEEAIFNELSKMSVPNMKELEKETFKGVLRMDGVDPNGFMLGAVVAATNGVVSLGVGALLGVNAVGGLNNLAGLAVATVAGGIASKTIDNPIHSSWVATGAGLIGTQLAAHGVEMLRRPNEVAAPEFNQYA
ncbi:hypothetical protein [Shewanella phage FishSpeaker]|nr:hypothetical protein [Shewanella phage FishSpeaker]